MNNLSVFQRLKDLESPDATMADTKPLVLSHGEGSFVWDVDGKQYIDLCAGFGSLSLGHKHPRIQKVLEQSSLYQGMGDVYASVSKTDCLESLKNLLPKEFSRGALAVTGSQAVEMAVKTAALASRGSGIICFSGAYHGLDLGVLPLAGRDDFREPFSSLMKKDNVERLPYGCPMSTLEEALKNLAKKKIKPACVVVEPILGRGGIKHPPKNWLKELSDFCQNHKILFILDEILTGSGRTGSITKSSSVPCDIICLGKALGGGFPISACFAKENVMKAWDLGQDESLHTGTFFGHPLVCEVSKETLNEIKESSLCKRSLSLGNEIRELLMKTLSPISSFQEVRGEGLLFGIELKEDGQAFKLMKSLREKGVIAIPCGEKSKTLSLTPALNIDASLLKESVKIIADCLKTL